MFFQNTKIKQAWARPVVQSNIEWSFDIFILASDHNAINYKKPLPAYLDFNNQILGVRYDEKHYDYSHMPHIGCFYNLAALRQVENLKKIHPKMLLPTVRKNTRNKADFFKKFVKRMGKTPAARGKALIELTFVDGKTLIVAVGLGVLPLLHKTANANVSDSNRREADALWVYEPVSEQGGVYTKLIEDTTHAYAKIKRNKMVIISANFCFLFFLVVFAISVVAATSPNFFVNHPQTTTLITVFIMILMGICVGISCHIYSKYLIQLLGRKLRTSRRARKF